MSVDFSDLPLSSVLLTLGAFVSISVGNHFSGLADGLDFPSVLLSLHPRFAEEFGFQEISPLIFSCSDILPGAFLIDLEADCGVTGEVFQCAWIHSDLLEFALSAGDPLCLWLSFAQAEDPPALSLVREAPTPIVGGSADLSLPNAGRPAALLWLLACSDLFRNA